MRRAALLTAFLVLLAGAAAGRGGEAQVPQARVQGQGRAGEAVGHAGAAGSRAARSPPRPAAGAARPSRPAAGPSDPGGDPAPPPPPPPPPPPEDPRYLQVVARDSGSTWALQPSRSALLSGSVAVEFNNRFAEDPHDLKLRHDGTTYAFPTVASGDARTESHALAAGVWKLWCSLPGHEAKGMVAYVTVADG